MGLPVSKLVIATNSNDILDRFWKTGIYEKYPAHDTSGFSSLSTPPETVNKVHPNGVKETLSPAMDILVSSNFERLLWYLAFDASLQSSVHSRRADAGEMVREWLESLKTHGKFSVSEKILKAAQKGFESERVSDEETIQTIRATYDSRLPSSILTRNQATKGTLINDSYVLDPHTAVGIAVSWRSIERAPSAYHISLATAHPAKFAKAVELALGHEGWDFSNVVPEEFVGLEKREKRLRTVGKDEGIRGVAKIIAEEIHNEGDD